MAGVGEASAIVGLIATGASLSKAIIDISSKYKDAEQQIVAFGTDLGFLSRILDQLREFTHQQQDFMSFSVNLLTSQIIDEAISLFSTLDSYRENLYRGSHSSADQGVSSRGKLRWVFKASELQLQRDRVNSMKINILLMMLMMLSHRLPLGFVLVRSSVNKVDPYPSPYRPESSSTQSQIAQSLNNMRLQGEACITRLEDAEDAFTTNGEGDDDVQTIVSFKTTRTSQTARQTFESIIDVQSHEDIRSCLESRNAPSSSAAIDASEQVMQASAVVADILSEPVPLSHAGRQLTQTLASSPMQETEKQVRGLVEQQYVHSICRSRFIVLKEPSTKTATATSQRTFPEELYWSSITRVARTFKARSVDRKIPSTNSNLASVEFSQMSDCFAITIFHYSFNYLLKPYRFFRGIFLELAIASCDVDVYRGVEDIITERMYPEAMAIRLQNITYVFPPTYMYKNGRRAWPELKSLYFYRLTDTTEEVFSDFYNKLKRFFDDPARKTQKAGSE